MKTSIYVFFESRNEFVWMSKNKRKLNSPDVSQIVDQEQTNMRIPLFVKKSNAEGNDFYYLGNMNIKKETALEKMIVKEDGDKVSVIEMNFMLASPVEKSLYDYLLNSN